MSDSGNHLQTELLKSVAKGAKSAMDDLPPHTGKSPVLACILGLLFGCIGIGLYLGRWSDFFMCLGIQIALALIPAPPFDIILAAIAAGVYGAYRAREV